MSTRLDGWVRGDRETLRDEVLEIEAGDGGAYLYELRPRQSRLGELSPAEVVDAIKELAR